MEQVNIVSANQAAFEIEALLDWRLGASAYQDPELPPAGACSNTCDAGSACSNCTSSNGGAAQ